MSYARRKEASLLQSLQTTHNTPKQAIILALVVFRGHGVHGSMLILEGFMMCAVNEGFSDV
jgi:hypothetical protein